MKKIDFPLMGHIFILVCWFFLFACGGGGEVGSEVAKVLEPEQSANTLPTTVVEIEVQIPELANARQLTASGNQAVVRVTVDVQDETGETYIRSQELASQEDSWVGQLEVPIGIQLTLNVHAYNRDKIEVYNAEETRTFTETPKPVSLQAVPVPKATASISLRFPSSFTQARLTALSSIEAIDSIILEIYDENNTLVHGPLTLAESNNSWSASITELPVGIPLTFEATADDTEEVAIFKGETTTLLESAENEILIFMSLAADADDVLLLFPRITKIKLPSEIAPATSGEVSITVEGNAGEELGYTLTADDGGIFDYEGQSGATISGTVNVGGNGETLLNPFYLAPATTGNYNNSVKMTNNLGNSIAWNFLTIVQIPSAQVSVVFNPIITELIVTRINIAETALYFIADLYEDPNQNNDLEFIWSFADAGSSSSTIASSDHTATLSVYDPEITEGTLTLIVSDPIEINGQHRTTTLEYGIPLGLFPNDAIEYVDVLNPSTKITLFSPSTLFNGNLASLVQAECEAGKIALAVSGNTVKPFLSTDSVALKDTPGVPANLPVVGPTGIQISANWAGLWDGGIDVSLRQAEVFSWIASYWTGTLIDGSSSSHNCNNWTDASNNERGSYGNSLFKKNKPWIDIKKRCNKTARVVCMSW